MHKKHIRKAMQQALKALHAAVLTQHEHTRLEREKCLASEAITSYLAKLDCKHGIYAPERD